MSGVAALLGVLLLLGLPSPLLLGTQAADSVAFQGKYIYRNATTMDEFYRPAIYIAVMSQGSTEARHRRAHQRAQWGAFIRRNLGPRSKMDFGFVIAKPDAESMELVHAQKEQFEYKDIVFLEQSNAGGCCKRPRTEVVLELMRWFLREKREHSHLVKMDWDVWFHPYHLQRAVVSLMSASSGAGGPARAGSGAAAGAGEGAAGSTQAGSGAGSSPLNTDIYFGRRVHDHMQGGIYILSKPMVAEVVSQADRAGSAALQRPEDAAVGSLLRNSSSGSKAYPKLLEVAASDYEIYDTGPHAVLKNSDAELGLLPPETIAVHRLRSSELHHQVHQFFHGSLLRWSSCVDRDFTHPRCQHILNGFPSAALDPDVI